MTKPAPRSSSPTPSSTRASADVSSPKALAGPKKAPLPSSPTANACSHALATVGVAYGVLDGVDVSAHTHLTTLAHSRLFGADLGVSGLVLGADGPRPAVALGGRGYVFTDFRSGALTYFDATAAVSWDAGRFRPYLMLAAQLATHEWNVYWALGVGTEVSFGRATLQLELRWYEPHRQVKYAAVEYLSAFQQGALGLQLSARYDFFPFTP